MRKNKRKDITSICCLGVHGRYIRVDKKMRREAKVVNFRILYGQGCVKINKKESVIYLGSYKTKYMTNN